MREEACCSVYQGVEDCPLANAEALAQGAMSTISLNVRQLANSPRTKPVATVLSIVGESKTKI